MIDDRPPTPFQQAKAELQALGVELVSTPGAYCFRYSRNGPAAPLLPETADDLAEAVRIGHELATRTPPPRLPPLGPTGRRRTRRGVMFKHNRKIAAKRRRKARTKKRPTADDDKGE